MRTIAPVPGGVADRINACAIQLKGLTDPAEVAYRFPKLARSLQAIANRAAAVRRHSGEPAGIDGPLSGLAQVVREHAAFDEPGGEPLRSELLRLVERVRTAGRSHRSR
jgi:hypothetical protein